MARLAAYPGWYKCDDKVSRSDITEVEVVDNYINSGNVIASWDASFEENGSIMAYVTGTKLVLVCDYLSEIPERMFNRFVSLKKATGFRSVSIIGAWAFLYTPSLSHIDIDPNFLVSIGHDAFRLSGVEDVIDFSNVPSDIIGERAIRSKRWSESGLASVREVKFPKYIYLDVPNADSQLNYKGVPYAQKNGTTTDIATSACRTLSQYHAWNCLYAGTSKEYKDFLTWFNAKLNVDGNYATNTIFGSDEQRDNDYAALGWKFTTSESISSSEQLVDILDKLAYGFPIEITMLANDITNSGDPTYHSVVIIGCDPTNRKLAIVDSGVSSTKGVIYWVAYEDLFTEGEAEEDERIRKVNYNPPVLGFANITDATSQNAWFAPPKLSDNSSITKSSITQIEIVRDYTPTGNETASWDASAQRNKKVMAYVNGTKLTIAGNGYRFIWTPSDSSYLFSDSASDKFTNLISIIGAEYLNTRNATTLAKAFDQCKALKYVNVSEWDTSNCTNMLGVFQATLALKYIDVSKWKVSKVTTMQAMFQGHYKIGASGLVSIGDVSEWDTSNVTNMHSMFNWCSKLQSINVGKWNTAKVTTFQAMFCNCQSLKELDFSNWETADASMSTMFGEESQGFTSSLEKVTIGKKFAFNSVALPTPSDSYIPLADGNWYDIDGKAYTSAEVAAANVARTYYASKFVIEGEDETQVFVTAGLLKQMAMAARAKSGTEDLLKPADALRLLALETDT